MRNPLRDGLLKNQEPRLKPPYPPEYFGDPVAGGTLESGEGCWEVAGDIRTLYDTIIHPKLRERLFAIFGAASISDWITLPVYMVGQNRTNALPTVMVCSEDEIVRKKAKKELRKSPFLKDHAKFKVMSVSTDPSIRGTLEQLASDTARGKSMPALKRAKEVLIDSTKPLHHMGTEIWVDHGSSLRPATAFATQLHGRTFLMTVDHAFVTPASPAQMTTDSPPRKLPIHVDSDSESDSESEDEDELNVAITSIGSQSPDTWSHSGSHSGSSSASVSYSGGSTPAIYEQYQVDQATTALDLDDISSRLAPFFSLPKTYLPKQIAQPSKEKLVSLGKLVLWSTDKDWALIEITNEEMIPKLEQSIAEDQLPAESLPGPKSDAPVVAYTSSSGILTGTFTGIPLCTRLPNSSSFQDVYRIRLNGPLANGDCGSPVKNAGTGELYGHIIAGCRSTGTAYIMAAHQIEADFPDLELGPGVESLSARSSKSNAIQPLQIQFSERKERSQKGPGLPQLLKYPEDRELSPVENSGSMTSTPQVVVHMPYEAIPDATRRSMDSPASPSDKLLNKKTCGDFRNDTIEPNSSMDEASIQRKTEAGTFAGLDVRFLYWTQKLFSFLLPLLVLGFKLIRGDATIITLHSTLIYYGLLLAPSIISVRLWTFLNVVFDSTRIAIITAICLSCDSIILVDEPVTLIFALSEKWAIWNGCEVSSVLVGKDNPRLTPIQIAISGLLGFALVWGIGRLVQMFHLSLGTVTVIEIVWPITVLYFSLKRRKRWEPSQVSGLSFQIATAAVAMPWITAAWNTLCAWAPITRQLWMPSDIAWMLMSTAFILLMIPGIGFFYAGLARRKSALTLLWLSAMSTAAIAFQWFFWGYSLTFFDTAGLYVRNDKSIELNGFRKSQSSRANPLKRDTGCPGVDLEMQHFEVSKPHDVTNFVLGTALLWFGWCGFKCASVPGASFRDIRFTILRLRYFGVRVAPSSALLATGVAAFLGEILYRVGGIELMRSGSSPPIITDVIVAFFTLMILHCIFETIGEMTSIFPSSNRHRILVITSLKLSILFTVLKVGLNIKSSFSAPILSMGSAVNSPLDWESLFIQIPSVDPVAAALELGLLVTRVLLMSFLVTWVIDWLDPLKRRMGGYGHSCHGHHRTGVFFASFSITLIIGIWSGHNHPGQGSTIDRLTVRNSHQSPGWRLGCLIFFMSSILAMCIVYPMRESSRWLMKHGKYKQALETFHHVRKSEVPACRMLAQAYVEMGPFNRSLPGLSKSEPAYWSAIVDLSVCVGIQLLLALGGLFVTLGFSADIPWARPVIDILSVTLRICVGIPLILDIVSIAMRICFGITQHFAISARFVAISRYLSVFLIITMSVFVTLSVWIFHLSSLAKDVPRQSTIEKTPTNSEWPHLITIIRLYSGVLICSLLYRVCALFRSPRSLKSLQKRKELEADLVLCYDPTFEFPDFEPQPRAFVPLTPHNKALRDFTMCIAVVIGMGINSFLIKEVENWKRMSFGVSPADTMALKSVWNIMDKAFFDERYRIRSAVRDFSQDISGVMEAVSALQRLLEDDHHGKRSAEQLDSDSPSWMCSYCTEQGISSSFKSRNEWKRHLYSFHDPAHKQDKDPSTGSSDLAVASPISKHRRGPWTPTEDRLLIELVQRQGPLNWVRISHNIQSRSPKQCRERYHQNLKPGLNHDPITPVEGEAIERMVSETGKKWAEIARKLGRSDDAVKNWWNLQHRRKEAQEKRDYGSEIDNCGRGSTTQQGFFNTGRATSAAPMFFGPLAISHTRKDFIDGVLSDDSPVREYCESSPVRPDPGYHQRVLRSGLEDYKPVSSLGPGHRFARMNSAVDTFANSTEARISKGFYVPPDREWSYYRKKYSAAVPPKLEEGNHSSNRQDVISIAHPEASSSRPRSRSATEIDMPRDDANPPARMKCYVHLFDPFTAFKWQIPKLHLTPCNSTQDPDDPQSRDRDMTSDNHINSRSGSSGRRFSDMVALVVSFELADLPLESQSPRSSLRMRVPQVNKKLNLISTARLAQDRSRQRNQGRVYHHCDHDGCERCEPPPPDISKDLEKTNFGLVSTSSAEDCPDSVTLIRTSSAPVVRVHTEKRWKDTIASKDPGWAANSRHFRYLGKSLGTDDTMTSEALVQGGNESVIEAAS